MHTSIDLLTHTFFLSGLRRHFSGLSECHLKNALFSHEKRLLRPLVFADEPVFGFLAS